MTAEAAYKNLVNFISQSVNTFLSVLKILVQSKFGLHLPKAKSERCIVLANGPSLKASLEKHPELFKQYPLICVNTFALTPEFETLKPKYYVILDPFFWKGTNEAIAATFKSLQEKTNWPLNLMVPKRAMNQPIFIELQKKNSSIILTPFNYTVFKGFPSLAERFYKSDLAMPQSLNVTIAALFLGINMKYKEIYLVGADHTWHENLHMSDENILYTKVAHFFENEKEIKFVPFLKAYPDKGTQKAHEFFDIWSRTFSAYFILNHYAAKLNCKIYNASEISFIDAFERIKLK